MLVGVGNLERPALYWKVGNVRTNAYCSPQCIRSQNHWPSLGLGGFKVQVSGQFLRSIQAFFIFIFPHTACWPTFPTSSWTTSLKSRYDLILLFSVYNLLVCNFGSPDHRTDLLPTSPGVQTKLGHAVVSWWTRKTIQNYGKTGSGKPLPDDFS